MPGIEAMPLLGGQENSSIIRPCGKNCPPSALALAGVSLQGNSTAEVLILVMDRSQMRAQDNTVPPAKALKGQ
jgi:hypothetical protein